MYCQTGLEKTSTVQRMIAACVTEYFQDQDKDDKILDKQASRASIHIGYRAVLDSKSSDETLVRNYPFDDTFFSFSLAISLYKVMMCRLHTDFNIGTKSTRHTMQAGSQDIQCNVIVIHGKSM